jgi:hypothetical protein
MGEKTFWSLIEFAWQAGGGNVEERRKLALGQLPAERAYELEGDLVDVIASLSGQLDQLGAEELLAFDRILERKLHAIDRRDVHEHTDGSDDGFLYARGFIVAAGKGYYEAVSANPAVAVHDLECEDMCYLSWHLYQDKFGEVPPSGISRESCSNDAGWE